AATAGGAGASVYYARVYGYNGAVNDYSLRVEVTPSPMDLDGDGVVEDRTTCGGPTNVGCPDIPLPGGTYYAQECNPRPNRGQGLALGQQLDLAELAGVCEPNTWAHRVHLDLVTDHPYADNLDEHLVVGLPSTASDVTLYGGYVETEANYDFLYLTDGTKISGIHASPQYSDSPTSRQVAGRRNRESIDLRFTSDSGVTDDGFHFGYFDWSS
ncbi:MAG: hypothetical protein K0V04_21600, partial [Deltaproteobacteria bacterium]|nr:hypothetical protein [Deltaproteobacteria bacterium]